MTERVGWTEDGDLARLGMHFGQLSSYLAPDGSGPDLTRLVEFAARVVPHAESCGVTLVVGRRRGETLAMSHPMVGEVDALQYQLREGPCLDASERDEAVLSDDLALDPRWPQFGPRCAAMSGVHSMLSTGVLLGSDRSALNLYSANLAAFDDRDVAIAAILAPFAAVAVSAILRERDNASLSLALGASRQIGTAVGILMARHQVSSEEAFGMLREASQHLNRKLRDLAAEVEWTGQLPGEPPPGGPGTPMPSGHPEDRP